MPLEPVLESRVDIDLDIVQSQLYGYHNLERDATVGATSLSPVKLSAIEESEPKKSSA